MSAINMSISNAKRRALPGPQFLDELIAHKNSADIAVEYYNSDDELDRLSYSELQNHAAVLCHQLLRRRELVSPNSIIPVIMPHSIELYIAYLGILKAGHAFCPISTDTPIERIRFIMEDVGACILLSLVADHERLTRALPQISCLSVLRSDLAKYTLTIHNHTKTTSPRHPSDIAYIMYTSGSTGQPKGVPVPHLSATQSILAHEEHFPSFKRFLQFAASTFDVSVFEIFFPWSRGSIMTACSRERLLEDLPGIINVLDVDAVELTPSVAATLLQSRAAVPKLKMLLTIGEMLTPQIVREFGGSVELDSLLYAMYGPTEAAIHCTIVPRMRTDSSVRNIGQPLATTTAFVLRYDDESDEVRILPTGEVGELAIAGQLANGYLKRPQQTSTAFVVVPGYGLAYRTGDKAVMRPDSTLEILGRISHGQVKLRGQRVELGEIEAAALRDEGLTLATALVVDNALVLFCVTKVDNYNTSSVHEQCRLWLPPHMLPNDVILLLGSMPRLASGKVDRAKLQQEYRNRSRERSFGTNKLNASETALLDIISEALTTSINPERALRSQGLDSLNALQLAARLRPQFPGITMVSLLEASSIYSLARRLQNDTPPSRSATQSKAAGPDLSYLRTLVLNDKRLAVVKEDIEDVKACSPMQLALLSQTTENSRLNMNQIVLELTADLSPETISQAFLKLSEQCEMLRSGFVETNDSRMPFVRVIWKQLALDNPFTILHPFKLQSTADEKSKIVHIHHALYDGWSWDLVMQNVNRLLKGEQPFPTFDFELFRCAQYERSLSMDDDLTYWTDLLQHARLDPFPLLHAEKPHHSERAAHAFTSAIKNTSLVQASQELDVSRAALVHTALCLLLSQYTASQSVLTGLVSSGRDLPINGVDRVIGPFLSTLPLLASFDHDMNLRQAARHVYQQHISNLQHNRPSLADIRSSIRMAASESLFDVLYVWQESPFSSQSTGSGVRVISIHDELDYTLIVEAEPRESDLVLRFSYDCDKVPRAHIEIFGQQLDFVLAMLVNHDDLSISRLWSSSPSGLQSVFNHRVQNCTLDHDLTRTIVSTASTDPHRIAVEYISEFNALTKDVSTTTLTYRQLFNRASCAASQYTGRYNMQRNDIVCLWMSKSVDLYILICGAAMAGIAYLCLDPLLPLTRVREAISQVGCKLVIADQVTSVHTQDLAASQVIRVQDINLSHHERDLSFLTRAEPNDLAYAVFTSGSTGVPKGVLITRANLYSNMSQLAELYPHQETSRLLQSCSPAFDVSVFEIFWTWHCGMTLVTASNDVLFRDIDGFIARLGVTHLSMTPSVAALVDPKKVPHVEFLVCAGEPMSAKVFNAWSERCLWQGYGPSETTNICNVRGPGSKRYAINNVGRAFNNTSIFICQKLLRDVRDRPLEVPDFRPLPLGCVGEIWIGGDQVGRGYTDPSLTARSWLEHPRYGRLYRSGDIGRLLADYSLVVLGRDDDQVKIRGQRIELNEISSTIIRSKFAKDALTMIVTNHDARDSLVSFWISATEPSQDKPSPDLLFGYLHESLPVYMIPELLLPLPNIPLTRQGKVDRNYLNKMVHSLNQEERSRFSAEASEGYELREFTNDEAKIATELASISGIPVSHISPYASLSTYGIDSIRAISLARRLTQETSSQVDASSILKHFSVKRLASHMRSTHEFKPSEAQPPHSVMEHIRPLYERAKKRLHTTGRGIVDVYACTSLQQAMLSTSVDGNTTSYMNHVVYSIHRDIDTIKDAWVTLIGRHQLLRTMFYETDDTEHPYLQCVLASWNLPWQNYNVQEATANIPSPFDGPPYALLHERSKDDHRLHLYMHHALYDAEALHLLHKEIEMCCLNEPLPLAVPFSRYIGHMFSVDPGQCEEFWNQSLHDVQPSRLGDLLGSRASAVSKSYAITRVAKMSLAEIQFRIRRSAMSLISLLQASVARLLSVVLAAQKVCFGTVYGGRNVNVVEIDHVVGPCFNTLPVNIVIDSTKTIIDLCKELHQFNTSVLDFQSTSLRQLQRTYSPDAQALFDVLLLLQLSDQPLDERVWRLVSEDGFMDFPFIFEIQPISRDDELVFTLHTTVCDQPSAQELLDYLITIVEDTLMRPTSRAAETVEPVRQLLNHCQKKRESTVSAPVIEQSRIIGDDNIAAEAVFEALSSLSKRSRADIDPENTIFHLGLDSINAAQLVSKLKRSGFSLSMAQVLQTPKIKHIIEACKPRRAPSSPERIPMFDLKSFDRVHRQPVLSRLRISENKVEAIWPCTAVQTSILSEFMRSNHRLYLNSMTLKLDDDVDLDHLRSCWTKAQRRHVMLRTNFVETLDPRRPYAMVVMRCEAAVLPWSEHDEDAREAETNERYDITEGLLMSLPWRINVSTQTVGRMLTIHILHALYDARSLHIILADVAAMYRGTESPHTTPEAEALGTILTCGEGNDQQTSFWSSVKPICQPTKFPNLHIHRSVHPATDTATRMTLLPLADVEAECIEMGLSLSVACQLAWAKLLSAYTGQESVTFGTTLSGRSADSDSLADVVFPCISTLPVCVDLTLEKEDAISALQKYNAGLQQCQHMSLTAIKRHLSIEEALFDTLLVLQKFDRSISNDTPWQIESEFASAEFAVSLEIIPEDMALKLLLTYNSQIMPSQHSGLILRQFESFLADVLDLRDSRYDQGNVPGIYAVAAPRSPLIPGRASSVHQMVTRQAHLSPERKALEYVSSISGTNMKTKTWSYHDTVVRANQIANLLIKMKVKQGTLVAICFDKCPEAAFAMLGILLAGCAYVAIDPGAPASRRKFILSDAECKVLLTTRHLQETLEQTHLVVYAVDDQNLVSRYSMRAPVLARPVKGDDICYCLYTSGTTGTPKGCLITHQSVVQAMLSFSRIFDGHWNEKSKWLQFAGYHFDVSVLEHFWSWSVGICVTVAPRDLLFEDLAGTIHKIGITHLDLTPSLARMLTPELVPALCSGVFIVGGEQVRQDIVEIWGDAGCLYNFYGPSEVTIGCTVHPRVKRDVKPTNIGRQWDNVGSYVLRPGTEEPVMIGAVGELCLGGILVGKGYLNRAELTAEKFVTLKSSSQRVYRTGDLVRMLHDQSFEFLGRIDDQIKLRGQRLEISEINAVISQASDELMDVTTLVLKHSKKDKEQLVAFLAFSENSKRVNQRPSLQDDAKSHRSTMMIRAAITDKLPSYMVPTFLLVVDFLPLTINNKVDTKTLRALYEETDLSKIRGVNDSHPGTENTSPAQIVSIKKVISSYLETEETSIQNDASLFQLGIDSVSVIGLSRVLKKAGFVKASIATLMKHSGLSDLARALHSDQEQSKERVEHRHRTAFGRIQEFHRTHLDEIQEAIGAKARQIVSIAPCTPLQEGMITKLVTSEDSIPPYLNRFLYQLDTRVNLQRLSEAWRHAYSCLDVLRTRFVSTEGGYAQVISNTRDKIAKISIRNIKRSESVRELIDVIFNSWQIRTRRLGQAPVWSVVLFEDRHKNQKAMALFMFHAIYDGISLPLLLNMVHGAYLGNRGKPDRVPQFHEALTHGILTDNGDAEQFWQTSLPQFDLLRFTNDGKAQMPQTTRSSLNIPQVRVLCKKTGVTPQAVFQTVWLMTLAREYGISPCIGLVVSGRSIDIDHADQIIGPLFNTIPFGIGQMPQGSTIKDLLVACHSFNVDALPFQHTSLSSIKKWLGHNSKDELFDSLFVYQAQVASANDHEKLLWEEIELDNTTDYPLNIEIEHRGEEEYSVTIAAQKTDKDCEPNRNLLSSFIRIVDSLVEHMTEELPACFTNPANDKPPHFQTNGHRQDDDRNPMTEEQTKIRDQIAALANVKSNTIYLRSPSLFELGLDSIDALKLAARLRNAGFVAKVSKILQNPTVAGISENSETRLQNGYHKAIVPYADQQAGWRDQLQEQNIDIANLDIVLPTTPMQESLLLEFEKYHHVMTHVVSTGIDVGKLGQAIQGSIECLPILRTRFANSESLDRDVHFYQLVSKFEGQETPQITSTRVVDISELKARVRRLRDDPSMEISMPSFTLVHVESENKTFLVIAMSHAHYDAASLQAFSQQVQHRYYGLEAVPDRLEDIAEYVNESRLVVSDSKTSEFWRNQLKHVQSTQIHSVNSHGQALLLRRLSSHSASDLQQCCRNSGVTLQALCLATWSLTLIYLARQIDVAFGFVVSGRTTEQSQRLVFPTFNTVIYRPQIKSSLTARELLRSMQDLASTIYEHQLFPLSKALKLVERSQSPLFNTLFTFQKPTDTTTEAQPLYEEIELETDTISPPYAVNVEAEMTKEGLMWTIAVQDKIFSADQVKHIFGLLDQVLEILLKQGTSQVVREHDRKFTVCNLPVFESEQSSVEDQKLKSSASTKTWTDTERKVQAVFAEISETSKQDIHQGTNLFNLGLDSISAIKVANALRQKGYRAPVSVILKHQTVSRIASAIASENGEVYASSSVDIKVGGERLQNDLTKHLDKLGINTKNLESVFPATAGQTYMLDTWQASAGGLFYATFWFEVSNCTKSTLEEAFARIVSQTPVLRTKFFSRDHRYYQAVFKSSTKSSPNYPWRFRIADNQDHDRLLVSLHIHHALYDGVSLELILQALQATCNGALDQLEIHHNITPYLDLTTSQSGSSYTSRKQFWTEYLESCSATLPRNKGTFASPRTELFEPSLLATASLAQHARQNGVSLQSLFFAALARVYSSHIHLNHPDKITVVLGIYLSLRSLDIPNQDLTTLTSPTFNILPLKVTISRATSLLAAAKQIQDDLVEISAADHCGASLREIHSWTGLRINCFVNFLKLPDQSIDRNDPVTESRANSTTKKADGNKGERDQDEKQATKIVHATGASLDEARQSLSTGSSQDEVSPLINPESVTEEDRAWCTPALDVEARVDEKEDLGMGLFAPADMLGQDEVEDFMARTKKVLEDACREG